MEASESEAVILNNAGANFEAKGTRPVGINDGSKAEGVSLKVKPGSL